jgi:hypothetical protein
MELRKGTKMKLRVILNGVSFYTTSTAIKNRRVGDNLLQNDALFYALEQMGKNNGIGTTAHRHCYRNPI